MYCRVVAILIVTIVGLSHGFRTGSQNPSNLQHSHRTLRLNSADDTADSKSIYNGWIAGYKSCTDEIVETFDLQLPDFSEGTYFRNGPAKFEVGTIGRQLVAHPMDGDGMVTAITIVNNSAVFRNRLVGTRGYLKERKDREGKVFARGAFGTEKEGMFAGFDKSIKNVANTNVIYWGQKLLALWEAGRPYRMEADSLRTFEKEYTFRGLLEKGQTFGALPKVDPHSDRLVAYSTGGVEGKPNVVTMFEFDAEFAMVQRRDFELPGFISVRDFAVTKNYYILLQPPVQQDTKAPAALPTAMLKDTPTKAYIIPRDLNKEMAVVDIDARFASSVVNAFDDGSKVVIDAICSTKMGSLQLAGSKKGWKKAASYVDQVAYSKLCRYSLTNEGSSWSVENGGAPIELSQNCLEYPSINPSVSCSKHRYVFCNTGRVQDPNGIESSPMQGLVKLDLEAGTESSWFPESNEFLGEPCFAQKDLKDGEDDGYILSFLNKGDQTTEFVVFDAAALEKGPVCRLPLSTFIPPGQHGCFAPGLVSGGVDSITRRFKACKSLDKRGWNEVKGGFSGLGISFAIDD